jgi:hypothetical protein
VAALEVAGLTRDCLYAHAALVLDGEQQVGVAALRTHESRGLGGIPKTGTQRRERQAGIHGKRTPPKLGRLHLERDDEDGGALPRDVDRDLQAEARFANSRPASGDIKGARLGAGRSDPDHRANEVGQVGGAARLHGTRITAEPRRQLSAVNDVAALDPPAQFTVEPPMQCVGEVLRSQEAGDCGMRPGVGNDGTQKRLLGGDVGRRQALRQA